MFSKLKWFRSINKLNALKLIVLYAVRKVTGIFFNFSYSGFGEDLNLLFINKLCLGNKVGFYIDVGCNNPIQSSITFNLYLSGWQGIAIDANKLLMDRFKEVRKKDIAVCCAISDTERSVTFYKSKSSDVSTIDKGTFEEWRKNWKFDSSDFEQVQTKTITKVLDEEMPHGVTEIDVLSVDVEGHDFEVLSGLDFNRYHPKVIIVEIFAGAIEDIFSTKIYQLLNRNSYSLIMYSVHNAYFRLT